MTRTRLTFALTLALAASPAFAQSHGDIDHVNGSITAEAGQEYGDLETVNGSIKLESNSRSDEVSTVNGSIQAGDGIKARSLTTVNGGIRIGEKVEVTKGLETVNGSIFVDRGGRIGDGIDTVNGSIGLVDTDLGGGIETVNSDITVGVGSHLKGGIHVDKPGNSWFSRKPRPPRIVIGPNAQVDGAMVFEREVVLYVHTSAKVGSITGAKAIPFSGNTPPE
ncbi:hypothetical protein LYSHEL_14140 [Lysobacter helvus]|uniref:Polymer-forming cytoskeletal protein n=2 Tax=Lysobacteraceae TaxID=32033 RepID=A0ABN6FRU5_9GAMM|nr:MULTISPECIES: hypothetical protein [Lysobacter]BCT92390.1 hypothetical protein LYSCAS_14140 [Lysobacter caseinilyticus]BCT95543.1 hypothetical protein LYSHEL_14140 [Lysobacter helvus]